MKDINMLFLFSINGYKWKSFYECCNYHPIYYFGFPFFDFLFITIITLNKITKKDINHFGTPYLTIKPTHPLNHEIGFMKVPTSIITHSSSPNPTLKTWEPSGGNGGNHSITHTSSVMAMSGNFFNYHNLMRREEYNNVSL